MAAGAGGHASPRARGGWHGSPGSRQLLTGQTRVQQPWSSLTGFRLQHFPLQHGHSGQASWCRPAVGGEGGRHLPAALHPAQPAPQQPGGAGVEGDGQVGTPERQAAGPRFGSPAFQLGWSPGHVPRLAVPQPQGRALPRQYPRWADLISWERAGCQAGQAQCPSSCSSLLPLPGSSSCGGAGMSPCPIAPLHHPAGARGHGPQGSGDSSGSSPAVGGSVGTEAAGLWLSPASAPLSPLGCPSAGACGAGARSARAARRAPRGCAPTHGDKGKLCLCPALKYLAWPERGNSSRRFCSDSSKRC